MEPLTAIAIGGSLLSGLVQYYNSEKARGASEAQLKRIEQQFNAIKPPDYDLSIDRPPQYHEDLISSPRFQQMDMSRLTPQKLEQVGTYVPEIAPLIKEVAPTLIQQTEGMKSGRDAQMQALKRFMEVGEGGFDPEYQQKIQEAARSAQTESQARQGALMDSFARRGISGSGLELASQMAGNAQTMDRLAQSNQQAATDSYRNQLQALAQGAGIGSDISNQDMSLQSQNANIINAFNQRMSAAQQNYEQQRAQMMNDAAVRNLAEKQRVADTNTQNANQFALNQQARGDDITKYQNTMAQQQYNNQKDQLKYNNQLAASIADWNANQRKYSNQLSSQKYQDQLSRASGMAGNYQAQAQNILGQAQDRNQAIGGLTNAAVLAAMYGDKNKSNNTSVF